MIRSINKQDMVRRQLARRFLVMQQAGVSRLPVIQRLAAEYGVGVGTVQGALGALKDSGAIQINSCGASGSFITASNRKMLFTACDYGELICLMPLNDNAIFRSLATAIYETISDSDIPVHILFARGSRNRINMVRRQMGHFAVMSELAYETARNYGKTDIRMVGPIGSYAEELGCMTRKGRGFDPGTTPVAFDDHSYDQLAVHRLLRLNSERRNDYLDVQLAGLVRNGDVAAAMALKTAPAQDDALEYHALSGIPADVQMKMRRAVVVVRAEEPSLAELLAAMLQPEAVASVQSAVLQGNMLVKY